ncbi:MAG: alpha/beta hydrolase family protein [Gemmatimonadales bacterium]
MIAAIAGIVAASSGVISNFAARGRRPHVGDIGSMTTLLIFCAAIAVPIVIFLIVKMTRNGDDEDRRTVDMNTSESDETRDDGDGNGLPRALVLAAVVAAIAIAVFVMFYAQPVRAQGSPDRGAFVVVVGADTGVVDRFVWTSDTLRGSVALKGQARVDYVVALGPQYTVRTMSIKQFKWGAAPGDAPTTEVLATMQADSVIFQMAGNTARLGTKAGAVPSFGNAFAIGELFTRRARASGGTGDYSYLAINGGVTLPVAVRPIGADSMTISIAGQQERFKVDAAGRMMGGSIVGQPAIITRASEAEAARITYGMVPLKPTEKPDYSAPRGAPYTAEEVSFKGPGGITLGGTLTKPVNARGPLPAVVTITGSGQQDRDEYIPLVGGVRLFRQVADTLSRVGIAVLRLDDRGMGASTGNFGNSTTADFADDIRAALAYLRSRTDIDPNRLALVGHSEGGMIAPMVAATDPRLRAIAIMAGPGDKMIDIMLAQNKWVADHNPKMTQAQRDSALADARLMLAPERQFAPAVKFWTTYDPAPAAKQVKAATLILNGETDRQVPVEQATKLAALIRSGGNKDVTVRTFPATDHLFLMDSTGDFLDMYKHVKNNKVSPVILGTLADWLVVKLGTPPVVK